MGRYPARIDAAPDALDQQAVLAANQAFYDAFEAADLDAMSALWDHGEHALCTHPGWATLQGWSRIVSSWYAIFGNPQRLQFILTDTVVHVADDTAWVSVTENLLDGMASSAVAALNVFVRGPDGWRLVVHHGSPVVSR